MTWLDRDAYPFQTRELPLTEGVMSVVDEGAGPPVVLVHGTPSWSWEWRGVVQALRPHGRVIAPDHLGFGLSSKPPTADYSMAAHTRRFGEVMDALDVTDAIVVVHDVAGIIGLPWVLDHPDRVRAVVLTNTFMWPIEGPMAWLMRLYGTAPGRAIYRWTNLSPRWLLPWAWGRHTPLTPTVHHHYLGPFPRFSDRHAVAAVPGELVSSSLATLAERAPELRGFRVRAVWGMADPLVGATALARWETLIPGLRTDTLPECGHFIADEAPDRVAAAIVALQEESPCPSPPTFAESLRPAC